MSRAGDQPPLVDEHSVRIAAPRERVWDALRRYVDTSLVVEGGSLLTRALGTVPRSGFEVSREVPGQRVDLSGRHRFSRYLLVFELADAGDGATTVSARSYAHFPGPHGRVYRALVIGSRGHVLAVRRMLRSIEAGSIGAASETR